MLKPRNRRRNLWLAAAALLALLALPIVAQICIWLLVLPFVIWVVPSLEAAGYFATPRSHYIAAGILNSAGLAAGCVVCWWGWRRLAGNRRGAAAS